MTWRPRLGRLLLALLRDEDEPDLVESRLDALQLLGTRKRAVTGALLDGVSMARTARAPTSPLLPFKEWAVASTAATLPNRAAEHSSASRLAASST